MGKWPKEILGARSARAYYRISALLAVTKHLLIFNASFEKQPLHQ